ncbi:unnamed protein product [Strongylus vulgaris]|uniref:Uncharacterized protein n=1 Tax=Strongylus vulgaris TaxID=40348 RepID=A0A3P7JN59_STRVU|nr:unnamed protein product [Strongylus vulgaris]
MREGNLPKDSKCVVCKKSCWSAECLAGMRCEWCGVTAHAVCYRQLPKECDFGVLRKILLPPSSLTIPRTELPMEQLLAITTNDPPQSRKGQTVALSFPFLLYCADIISTFWDKFDHFAENNRTCLKIFIHAQSKTDDVSSSGEDMKEREDTEILRVFDGNSSLRAQICRTASVPKTATVQQIRDTAMRRFHITDNPDNYYVTQVVNDGTGDEETLEDPVPLRNVKRPEGRRAQIFLRYKDDPEKDVVKLYGGWLRYNLIEVSLDRGVAERTCNPQENMLQLVRNLRKDSLRRYHVVRFYVQEKEDPHDHAVFVGNLPVSLAQRQYERILLKLLGAKGWKEFYAFTTFPHSHAQPVNFQPHMLAPDAEPLLVLVNVKSGGCQGTELIQSFRKLLNPFQVFDVLKGGPLVGLYVFRNIPKYKILACGGDGTIGWVLQCLDIAKQDAACFSPPCGIVPLGTGNDLARVLRWGGGYTGEENPLDILKDVIEADEVRLDSTPQKFILMFELKPGNFEMASAANQAETDQTMSNPEDQTSMIIMNNYFGIGIDADVCLKFHNKVRKTEIS